MLIHGKDGEIEDRNNYKRDPYPPRANCSRQSVPATTASSFLVTQGSAERVSGQRRPSRRSDPCRAEGGRPSVVGYGRDATARSRSTAAVWSSSAGQLPRRCVFGSRFRTTS